MKIGLKTLHNNGIKYIGDEKKIVSTSKTIIVLGIARGGTSLVSGTLHHLGVFSGEKSVAPVFEDTLLSHAFESSSVEEAKNIIDKYNATHQIWSFKRPLAIDYIEKLDKMVENPVYLIIFKDIFSVSNRNALSMKSDSFEGLRKAYNDYGKILDFIENTNFNGYLLSYEKLMQNKELFVDEMIKLIGPSSVNKKNNALNFIEPNPKEYIDKSRSNKSIGRIGSIEKTKVIGWAKHLYSNETVVVELYINGKLEKEIEAKDFRPHVKEKNIHPTGNCGYLFDLSGQELKEGDKVSVKVKGDVVFLDGSEKKYISQIQIE